MGTKKIVTKVVFGKSVAKDAHIEKLVIEVQKDGSQSIQQIKQLVAKAAGGAVTPDDILLSFGPNDRKMGRQFAQDPAIDESKLLLKDFTVLQWLERFPEWTLTARLMPPTPPPPGVAIKRAAAIAEQKDPERAVQDGRAKGEIPKINELPAPWGPKPHEPASEEELIRSGYKPAKFPAQSSPLIIS